MLATIFSAFKSKEKNDLKSFFIGQSVAIVPAFYEDTHSNSFDTPIYGWYVKSISGSMATLALSSGKPGKVFIETKYLKSA